MVNLLPWITKGTRPVGSIVRSISATIRLDAADIDSWASDFLIYMDGAPETPGTAALLQIGGDYGGAVGTVAQTVGWEGGDGGPGTTINQTLTAGVDWTGDIDLNAVQLSIGNNYGPATWSGTITVEYDITALAVELTTPADTQGYPSGTSITATATVLEPVAGLTHTVTFHTTPITPPGPTVQTVSTDTSSPFSGVLGELTAGTYQINATVVNNDVIPGTATSATHTFTVAAAQFTTTTLGTTNPSTYGQSVTFTATVAPVPTGGTVQFKADSVNIGNLVPVNTGDGTASFSTSALAVAGPNSITADFSGYGVYLASAATAVTQTVGKAPLTVRALNTLRAPNTPNPDPFPYQITGYQNGEVLLTSGVGGTPALTTLALPESPPANYDITSAIGGLTASNYSFTFVDGILTVAVVADTFSVNFYVGPDWPYGGLTTDEQKANVLVPAGVPAGLGDWFTSGWTNVLVPWGGGRPLQDLTSNQGSTATFNFKDCRNGWTYNGARTTLLGDGNGNMMDAHVNSTLDPGDGSNLFDMEMTNIPFAVYDVIFYIGGSLDQFGDGTGVIVFNGGAERAFKLKPGAFDGTFTEMVDATTPGNYIVFPGVTGASFTTQTWGTGDTGFNHVGPFGFQIREAAVAAGYNAWATTNGVTGGVNGDSNNDGMQNGIAYFMNDTGLITNPGITGGNTVTWLNGGKILAADYGTQFVVQTSPDLVIWTPVPGDGSDPNLSNIGASVSYTLTPGVGKKFVRLVVTPTL
jgi:hypothetical protein